MVHSTLSSASRADLEQATTGWLMLGGFSMLGGFVGTLIGLVQMLHNMADPASIGPAMAVALLSQLYGIGLLFLSLMAALSCARRASTAALGGLTVLSMPAVVLLGLGIAPLSLLSFGALALMA